MNILDRYIGLTVAGGIMIAMTVLLALYIFLTYVAELDKIGTAHYTALIAFEYTLLTVPRWASDLFPMAALLGSLISLGGMAGNSELTVMRAAGISVMRIAWSVMKVALLMMVLVAIIGELVAPVSGDYAQKIRAEALNKRISVNIHTGLWMRDGSRYINVRTIHSSERLGALYVYEYGENNKKLRSAMVANRADYQGDGKWLLNGVRLTFFDPEGYARTEHKKSMVWKSALEPGLVDVVAVEPQSLSTSALHDYIQYLEANELNAERYKVVFWSKIISPFSTGVMMLLAIPFIFGSMRSVSVGNRLLVGALIGISFYLFNNSFGQLGVVYELPPLLSASLPTMVVLTFALYMIQRIRR